MIDDLKSMAREIMIEYFNSNGGTSNPDSRPERVIFYRDGVSESQFQAVLQEEIPFLRAAFQSLGDGSYNPTITYIVAQKRHNTRLFVANPRDGEGRNRDVPAGTVVDTGRVENLLRPLFSLLAFFHRPGLFTLKSNRRQKSSTTRAMQAETRGRRFPPCFS